MKKIKELSTLIFPPVFVLSTLTLNPFLQGIREFEFIYMNRTIFILIGLFIILYIIYLSKIVEGKFSYNSKIKNLIIITWGLLLVYSISVFIHPIGEGMLFFNMLLINIGASIVLSLIIALIFKRYEKD